LQASMCAMELDPREEEEEEHAHQHPRDLMDYVMDVDLARHAAAKRLLHLFLVVDTCFLCKPQGLVRGHARASWCLVGTCLLCEAQGLRRAAWPTPQSRRARGCHAWAGLLQKKRACAHALLRGCVTAAAPDEPHPSH